MASRPSNHDHMAALSFFDLTVFDAMMRLRSVTLAACQSACKRDPLSARKRDPLSGWRNVDVTGFLALRVA